ncbi:hypothetical protein MXF31_09330 [Mammaliicoccus sciuri]|uniref:hypothetical protein n=1 Tax=Mammaliicoccus sciuri TaxID=1296 RepID=UPI002DB6A0F8|nr:hypothetical protein [Mammaliicoccus sciuri]MEB5649854.1 hypothetical protein [Mammaliicoccus sciuri]
MSKLEYKKLNVLFAERDERYQEIFNSKMQNTENLSDYKSLELKFSAYQEANDEFLLQLLRTMNQLH